MTNYSIIRSKRKTIAIRITDEATVEVLAPLKATQAYIDRLVTSKQDWINNHLESKKHCVESKAAFALNYGDSITLRGKPCQIIKRDGNRAGFDGEVFFLPPGLPSDSIKKLVIQSYKLLAKRLLTDKTAVYSELMGLTPSAVKVNSANTRWGSCSGKNSINFSWKLVMADDEVIDYVVVHELAHIREHNHSGRFWTIVAAVLPDYKKRQVRLKELQKRLAAEVWD